MRDATLQLVVAAFDGETAAEEALKTLKEAQDEKLVGIQAAVAMRKDDEGQIHRAELKARVADRQLLPWSMTLDPPTRPH